MENTNAIDEIKRMAEILSASRTERKAFVLMPTFKGFDVFEVSESLAQHCISAEALRKSAEADSTGERQSNIPDVSNCYMADCLIQDSCLRFKQQGCNKDCKLYM